jgi:hypothetical protein
LPCAPVLTNICQGLIRGIVMKTRNSYTHTRTHTHTHTHTQHRPLWRMRKGHKLYTIPLQSRRSQTQTRVLFLYSFPEKVWLRYSASLFTSSMRCSTSAGNGSYRLFFSGGPCEFLFHSTLPDYLHRPYIAGDSYHVFVPEF